MLSFTARCFPEEPVDLRSRQCFLALLSSSSSFTTVEEHVSTFKSWFHQRKRNLPRRTLDPDGGGEALEKALEKPQQ
jgi:hypothetical protein